MPPEPVNPTPAELQWLNEFMAAETARLAETSGAKAAQDFRAAMGGASQEVREAWLESDPAAVAAAARLAVEQAGGEVAGAASSELTEAVESIATRIYSKAVNELREDEIVLGDADLSAIWQDAWAQARSWTPQTAEEEAVTRVTDSFTMKIMNEVDGDALYQVIAGFIADIQQLTGTGS